jgi:hypothetical protein
MLSHAATEIGYSWAFGMHEALDQFGALFGPLAVAGILVWRGEYRFAFAVLLLPAVLCLVLLLVTRLYPRPEEMEREAPKRKSKRSASGVLGLSRGRGTGCGRVRGFPAHRVPFPVSELGSVGLGSNPVCGSDGRERRRLAGARTDLRSGRHCAPDSTNASPHCLRRSSSWADSGRRSPARAYGALAWDCMNKSCPPPLRQLWPRNGALRPTDSSRPDTVCLGFLAA